jgi:hypothetical protein
MFTFASTHISYRCKLLPTPPASIDLPLDLAYLVHLPDVDDGFNVALGIESAINTHSSNADKCHYLWTLPMFHAILS